MTRFTVFAAILIAAFLLVAGTGCIKPWVNDVASTLSD